MDTKDLTELAAFAAWADKAQSVNKMTPYERIWAQGAWLACAAQKSAAATGAQGEPDPGIGPVVTVYRSTLEHAEIALRLGKLTTGVVAWHAREALPALQAALAAATGAQAAIPPGWKLVPRSPSGPMLGAGVEARMRLLGPSNDAHNTWTAMWDAAPAAPK